jgi:uncharacterized protein (DUF58 family)
MFGFSKRSGKPAATVDAPAAVTSPSRTSRLANRAAFLDPTALLRIKSLQLRAKTVVEGFFAGLHRSPYHGFSVEFAEYRPYSPGDDPRYLDWRLYARTDRYYIKRFEDETNLRCWLLVDQSRSMSFGTTAYTKAEYCVTLAATLAYFLSIQRDAAGLLTFDEHVREYLPPRRQAGHWRRLLASLERVLAAAGAGTSTDLAAPIEQIAALARKRGLIVLISDMLSSIDDLETRLGYLRSQGHEVVVFRVLDPAELDFPFASPALFEDLESSRELYVDPAAAKSEYLRRFQNHAAGIAAACRNLGVDLYTFTTARPMELALYEFLGSRESRHKRIARRAYAGARAARGSTGPVQGAAT